MASGWLKIDKTTPDKPEVFAIASRLKCDRARAFLACVRVWNWADDNSDDGKIGGATAAMIDEIAGIPGIAEAMQRESWLIILDDGIVIPNFDRHMGSSAKKRLTAAERQRRNRDRKSCHASVTKMSRSKRDKSVTREEKRREEKNTGGVPPVTPPSADKPPCGEIAPAPAEQPAEVSPTAAKTPRPRNELFDAVVEITCSDPKASGSYIGKVVASLRKSEPPYTPAEVRALPDLLAQRGYSLPLTLGTVEKEIGKVRAPPVLRVHTQTQNHSHPRRDTHAAQRPGAAYRFREGDSQHAG